MLSWIWQDFRFGIRVLAKRRSYSILGLATLALGIGVTTTIFSFVDAVLLKPLPYPSADRIVRVVETRPSGVTSWISTLNFLDWKRESNVFEHLAAVQQGTATITGRAEPLPVRVNRVSADYFDVFGVTPHRGRFFSEGEDEPGNGQVAVLSHSIWQREFGASETLIGDTVLLDGEPYVVVGVVSEDSAFDRSGTDVWHPLALQTSGASREYRWINATYGLLKSGVTLGQARSQMESIGSRLAADFPDSNRGWSIAVDRYEETIVAGPLRTSSLVLMAAVGGLLLICFANLASLMLARAVSRSDEVAVRFSMGATSSRIAAQFILENLLLIFGGTILGIGLAVGGVAWIRRLIPTNIIPNEASIVLDARAVTFAIAIAIVCGLVFGLVPFLRTKGGARSTSKSGSTRGATSGYRTRRFLNSFVVAQIALSVTLAVSATLLMRSFVGLMTIDTGFETTDSLTMRLPVPGFPPGSVYESPDEFKAKIREILATVGAVPGVTNVAMTTALPLTDCCLYQLNVQIEGRPPPDRANRGGGYFKIVTPSYLSALGLELVSGRFLTNQDNENGRPAIVINERLADQFFSGEDPIGHRILNPEILPGRTEKGGLIPWEIVGVVANERITGLNDDASAVAYASYEQSPAYFVNLIVKSEGDPAVLERPVRRALNSVDPSQSILDVRTMDQIRSSGADRSRLQASLLSVFTAVAVFFAAVGLFGVLAYGVSQRSREIGIRSAVGATRFALLLMIMREALAVTGIGLAIGLTAAFFAAPLMGDIVYKVTPRDPYLFVAIAIAFVAVAIAASLAPAFRAAGVDANTVLRGE